MTRADCLHQRTPVEIHGFRLQARATLPPRIDSRTLHAGPTTPQLAPPTDPDENAASLSNLAEILFSCLAAIDAGRVIEIGAFHGKSTGDLVGWATRRGARITAVDPSPQAELLELAAVHPELELIEATSHVALRQLPRADAVLLDGDHNWYTLIEELRLIEARAPEADLPLIMLHDLGWPLARRDSYYAPERIPPEHRQPLARKTFLVPGAPGVVERGMPFECVAAREGGPRNGILTAVEDFVGERAELRLAIVPAFFGLGVLWHRQAPWAEAVEAIISPWDRNPLLARMEENRVAHMAERWGLYQRLEISIAELNRHRERRQALHGMLGSRAFALAESLSRLHGRGRPAFSRAEVRRTLDE